jgi:hypothetical protein
MSESTQDDDLKRREFDLKEREVSLKENEQRSWMKSPLILSIVGAIVAVCGQMWMSHLQHERELADRTAQAKATLDQASEQYQGTLIEKATEHQDTNRVIAKLQLLNELDLVPHYRENIKALLRKDGSLHDIDATASIETLRQYQAALIERALVPDDPGRVKAKFQLLLDAGLTPEYRQRLEKVLQQEQGQGNVAMIAPAAPPAVAPVAPAVAAPAVPATPHVPTHASAPGQTPAACASALVNPAVEGGWLFLGRTNQEKSAWESGESGSQTVHFEKSGLSTGDPDLVKRLKDQCLSTLTAKYLREDGEPGKKVDAKVKSSIPRGTRLRIVEIDDLGKDEKSRSQYPVLWARVVVLAD